MAIQNLYPNQRPSLDLNFAGSKTVDPRITFTRNSTATYFDEFGVMRTAASGVPRIDHDPVTGECLGLLIEDQRTNLLTYSEQFDNAAWTKSNLSVTPNVAIAPDGTLTADKLIENTAAVWRHVSGSVSNIAATTHTFILFAKAAERSVLQIVPNGTFFPTAYANFDLAVGVVSASSNIDSASITNVGNGWYRCVLVDTATTGGLGVGAYFSLQNSPSAARAGTYTGDGTSGIYIWGAQIEEGTFPTSYIKTEATSVTRAADNAVMTGSNFSSWYSQSEGTVFVNYNIRGKLSNSRALSISDGSSTNALEAVSGSGGGGTGGYMFLVSAGVGQAAIPETVVNAPNANYTTAMSYKTNDVDAARNGVAGTKDTDAAIPVMNRMYLGANATGTAQLSGTIKRVAFYPKKLGADQLVALTQ